MYLYSPSNPSRNYFDCLADSDVGVNQIHAKSLTIASRDPGEGVLLAPLDVTHDVTQCHCQEVPEFLV